MAEIILSAEQALEHQLRKVLNVALKLGHGLSTVVSSPAAGDNGDTLPHGVVVTVPDEVAEAYAKQAQLEAARAAKRGKTPTEPDQTPQE